MQGFGNMFLSNGCDAQACVDMAPEPLVECGLSRVAARHAIRRRPIILWATRKLARKAYPEGVVSWHFARNDYPIAIVL